MSSTAATFVPPARRAIPPGRLLGRSFVHPVVDYLVVGGGLSLLVTAVLLARGSAGPGIGALQLAWIVLFCNSAHFASSTVRLYTKPGAFERWPFLTMGFPLVAIGVLAACIVFADVLGPHLQALYLTWSPYHYAAQAYGLAVVYSFRSGRQLGRGDKRLLWWAAMLPFFHVFLIGSQGGLGWLVPRDVILTVPGLATTVGVAAEGLRLAAFAAPLALVAWLWRGRGGPVPVIVPLLLFANGIWWLVLGPLEAFVWATIFHGLQYLAIVVVFHVKDQVGRPGNRHGALRHALTFYGTSLVLGYVLFQVLPGAFVLAGSGMVESLLLVAAAINVHHFVVDAFIWRLRPGDSNRRIVEARAG